MLWALYRIRPTVPEASLSALSAFAVPRSKRRIEVTHSCEYRVAWCTTMTRPVLKGLEGELTALISEQAVELGIEVRDVMVSEQVVSMVIKVDPTVGVHKAVTRLKAATSSVMAQRHASVRRRVNSLWTSRYFVRTVGAEPSVQELREFFELQRR